MILLQSGLDMDIVIYNLCLYVAKQILIHMWTRILMIYIYWVFFFRSSFRCVESAQKGGRILHVVQKRGSLIPGRRFLQNTGRFILPLVQIHQMSFLLVEGRSDLRIQAKKKKKMVQCIYEGRP